MKRVRSRGVVCNKCGEGIRLVGKQAYVRCRCGNVGLYGRMDEPVIIVIEPNSFKYMDSIVPVDDNYVLPKTARTGVLVVNHRAKSIFGMPTDVIEQVMPLLSFGFSIGWTDKDLYKACESLINYAKMVDNTVK